MTTFKGPAEPATLSSAPRTPQDGRDAPGRPPQTVREPLCCVVLWAHALLASGKNNAFVAESWAAFVEIDFCGGVRVRRLAAGIAEIAEISTGHADHHHELLLVRHGSSERASWPLALAHTMDSASAMGQWGSGYELNEGESALANPTKTRPTQSQFFGNEPLPVK